jgi:hypothetical protein
MILYNLATLLHVLPSVLANQTNGEEHDEYHIHNQDDYLSQIQAFELNGSKEEHGGVNFFLFHS